MTEESRNVPNKKPVNDITGRLQSPILCPKEINQEVSFIHKSINDLWNFLRGMVARATTDHATAASCYCAGCQIQQAQVYETGGPTGYPIQPIASNYGGGVRDPPVYNEAHFGESILREHMADTVYGLAGPPFIHDTPFSHRYDTYPGVIPPVVGNPAYHPVPIPICQNTAHHFQHHAAQHPLLETANVGVGGDGGGNPHPPGESATSPAIPSSEEASDSQKGNPSPSSGNGSLGGGGTVGGVSGGNAIDVPSNHDGTGHHSVGATNQVNATQPIHAVNVHSHRGTLHGFPGEVPLELKGGRTNLPVEHVKDQQRTEETIRSGLQQPLDKTRGNYVPAITGSPGHPVAGGSHAVNQAQATHDASSIRRPHGGQGSAPRHPKSHEPNALSTPFPSETLNCKFDPSWDEEEVLKRIHKHTITHARHPTRVATPADLERLRDHLHTPKERLGEFNVSSAREMMNDHCRKRFDECWERYCDLPTSPPVFAERNRVPSWACFAFAEDEVLERVTPDMEDENPTLGAVIVFFVVEERDDAERLRMICWTRIDNEFNGDYIADVPIRHVSHYLPQVHAEAGGKRDAKCGFYQLNPPKEVRAKYRFYDADGNLWQLCRGSMGHCVMPEIMQRATGVTAGHPDYVQPQFVLPVAHCDILIDGVRAADTMHNLDRYFADVDARAELLGLKWNTKDSVIGTRYVFDGVEFDHTTHKVAVGPKLRAKIARQRLDRITYGELESLVARLDHASAIVQAKVPKYYWVLKFVRRRINLLNRGIVRPDEILPDGIPDATLHLLRRWINEVVRTVGPDKVPIFVTPPKPGQRIPHLFTLFTDASKKGWGAVLIFNPTGQVWVAGDRWPAGHSFEINKDEMRAVSNAIAAFTQLLSQYPDCVVDLRVDNTSVEHAIRKGRAKSANLSEELVTLLETKEATRIGLNGTYVNTKHNLADAESRGEGLSWRLGG